MKKYIKIYITLLLSAICFINNAIAVNSETGVNIHMEDIQIPENSMNWGTLKILNITNLGSFSINLSWDTNNVDINKIKSGDLKVHSYINHEYGFVTITGYSIEPVNGSIELVDILFEAISNAGTSNYVKLTYCELLTADPKPETIDCIYNENLNIITITEVKKKNGSNGDEPVEKNLAPTANISVSAIRENVNTLINFNASESFDKDGTIESYIWDFNDGKSANGVNVNHKFYNPGIYKVKLTVKDNNGVSDEETVEIFICKPNHPPDKPMITGPNSGKKGTKYEYSIISRDVDNDTIFYNVDWGDNNSNTTNFVDSNSSIKLSHKWSESGRYSIKVNASDNQSVSETSKNIVLIDSRELYYNNDYIGYVSDKNGDGIFDRFKNNKNQIERTNSSMYLIDINNDDIWDYVYNSETENVTDYKSKNKVKCNTNQYDFITIGVILLGIFLCVILAIFSKKKFKKR